ncbi:cytochrome P450, partial [Hyaloscypha finlandica]
NSTSSLLGNIFFLISHGQSVFKKLRTEVLSAIGDLNHRYSLKLCEIVLNILSTALRLYPVLPELTRHAKRDTVLPVGGGPDGRSPIFCPKGSESDTSFQVLHHLHEIWGPDAREFKAERWDRMRPNSWEHTPLGGGPRVCAGQRKAALETSYVIARMLQEFEKIESRENRP